MGELLGGMRAAFEAAGVSDGVALASLAISLWVLWRQRHTAGLAHLILEHDGDEQMLLVNLGPGAARDVKGRFGSRTGFDFDVPYLAPGQAHRFDTGPREWGERSATVSLIWRDGRWREQSLAALPGSAPRRRSRSTRPNTGVDAAVETLVESKIEVWERDVARRIARNRRSR